MTKPAGQNTSRKLVSTKTAFCVKDNVVSSLVVFVCDR